MHSSTMGRSLLWCPPLPPEKSSSPPLSSDGAFSAPPKRTFVLPPQPASSSLPGSASSHDVTSLHLEDLESFANEAFPEYVCQISWKIFESPAYSKYLGTWILKKILFFSWAEPLQLTVKLDIIPRLKVCEVVEGQERKLKSDMSSRLCVYESFTFKCTRNLNMPMSRYWN